MFPFAVRLHLFIRKGWTNIQGKATESIFVAVAGDMVDARCKVSQQVF